ncbi:rhamnose/proton symporter RhaT [Reichenbachiella carrageenanivorans]|uniref:Rhamnose/proton symporter RhaT n=1 Tax=Reichenbachiella carrageenanivorans TaxID=2979869 RepID=A0ABY6CV82_9BACT|nr:L-rhamnose/proton symporter RhaT [Reichenbachiella carrageenanivorans]UXX77821.1 rhamnose/proton symporter RhaT [Reichenbachiella carrageenanivorans]
MEFVLPFILVLFASFFQGTFGLGMKHIAPLKWEAWWLLHSFVAMIFVPMVWASIVVPDLFDVIAQTDNAALSSAMLYGFLWGIGGILFGVSVEYTGISITYGIVMGLAASMGCVIPLIQIDGAMNQPAFPIILIGVTLLLVGVAITAIAGVQRDKKQTDVDQTGKSIKVGILIAVASGVLSAFLNVGFSNAAPVADIAINQFGAGPRDASLAAWVVVLIGAFAMNGGYALFLLVKNNSWSSYRVSNSGKAYKWAILAGVFWFAALGVYGQGAALMGSLGPVIGWPILLGLALVISNIWAYRGGEWQNAQKPFKILLAGLIVLIIAICILGYANY